MTIKICPTCGKEFGHNRPARYTEKRTYCSHSCKEKAKANPKKKITKICKTCGKPFESWTYRHQIYCSVHCKNIFAARQPKPSTRKPENFVTLRCEWCNKEYTVHKIYNSGDRQSRFCSATCRQEWISRNQRGINHPRFIGGARYADRGSNWGKQRHVALKRDNYTCQLCGKKRKKGEKYIIDVHHIKPFKDFNGDYIMANELTNLITLCRKCHTDVDKHGFPCPMPLF